MHGRSGGYDSMIDFFEKTKGSISLFLALIMLPMMTVAGLIVDGARISAAKASLSGAGDLAMNAALSEYDQILYDVYGIFAVSENMEELQNNVSRYFANSIDNTGILNDSDSYASPVQLAKAMTAELSVELAEATLYADDGASEIVKEFKSGTLSLGVDDIGATAASDLTGATIDKNGVVVSASEDGGEPVAVGFRAKKSNGKYKYFWLYRVKFGIPATNLATKGDSITFSTPTIEGTILRRNKPDAKGAHPWKAEVTEGDATVTAATISNWYKTVYEPTYAASPEKST